MAKRNLDSLCTDDDDDTNGLSPDAKRVKSSTTVYLPLHDLKGRHMDYRTSTILDNVCGQRCTKCKRHSSYPITRIFEQFGCAYEIDSKNDAGRAIIVNITIRGEPRLFLCTYCTYSEIAHLTNLTVYRQRAWFSQDYRPLEQEAAAYLVRCLENRVVTKLMVIVLPNSKPVAVEETKGEKKEEDGKVE